MNIKHLLLFTLIATQLKAVSEISYTAVASTPCHASPAGMRLMDDSEANAFPSRATSVTGKSYPLRRGASFKREESLARECSATPKDPLSFSTSAFSKRLRSISMMRSVDPERSMDRCSQNIEITPLKAGYIAMLIDLEQQKETQSFIDFILNALPNDIKLRIKPQRVKKPNEIKLANTLKTDANVFHMSLFQGISQESINFFEILCDLEFATQPTYLPIGSPANPLRAIMQEFRTKADRLNRWNLYLEINEVVVENNRIIGIGNPSDQLNNFQKFAKEFCTYTVKNFIRKTDMMNRLLDDLFKNISFPFKAKKIFEEFVDICRNIDPISEHRVLRQVEWDLKHTVWCILGDELEKRSNTNVRLIDLLEICQDRSLKENNPFIELYRRGIFLPHITIAETKSIHGAHRFILREPFVIYLSEIYCGDRTRRTKHIAYVQKRGRENIPLDETFLVESMKEQSTITEEK